MFIYIRKKSRATSCLPYIYKERMSTQLDRSNRIKTVRLTKQPSPTRTGYPIDKTDLKKVAFLRSILNSSGGSTSSSLDEEPVK